MQISISSLNSPELINVSVRLPKQTLSQPDEALQETTDYQEEVDPLNGFIGTVAHGSLASRACFKTFRNR